jgi:superfamily I DNA and RNA helicase
MIRIIRGESEKPATSQRLTAFFESNDFEGILYIGYPILNAGGSILIIDAIWISEDYGVVIFDLVEGEELSQDVKKNQDDIFVKFRSKLSQYTDLNVGREFSVSIDIITYATICREKSQDFKIAFTNENLFLLVSTLTKWENKQFFKTVLSVIQSVVKLNGDNKRKITKPDSRGAKVKKLEETLANLDKMQEEAVIQFVDGPQRIRGLAGSGKTIVLALKAAYLHVLHPDWDICITFNTRSLKEQFKRLVEKFCAEKTGDTPNWEKIRIIHAWGGIRTEGLYFEICKKHGLEFYDFNKAKNYKIYNNIKKTEFDCVCEKAQNDIKKIEEIYDLILIDEAQDLPESFLRLCYESLRQPKRIIYAYDELQNLNKGKSLRSPIDIFGVDAKDTILNKCYRNSRPILVTAHALGFGIYKDGGMVQFFDQPELWNDLGYSERDGKEISPGNNVILYRNQENSPLYLENHSDIDDLLSFKSFLTVENQSEWVADEIEKNLKIDELKCSDIIVINPEAITTKREVSLIRKALFKKDIETHIAGELDSDIFLKDNSITFTGINRAKGNESAMIYIINSDYCYSDEALENRDLIKKRNILFTALTRSKAWVRVCGVGDRMNKLIEEYAKIKSSDFVLDFKYPSPLEIEKMNLIHRDITSKEKTIIGKEADSIAKTMKIIKKISKGEKSIDDYPKETQEILRKLLNEDAKNQRDCKAD